jgi:hypothetical protein
MEAHATEGGRLAWMREARLIGRERPGGHILLAATAAWVGILVWGFAGGLTLETCRTLAVLYPLLLTGVVALGFGAGNRSVRVALGLAWLIAAGMLVIPRIGSSQTLALAPLALLAAAAFGARFPAAALLTALTLSGVYGTIEAFFGYLVIPVIEVLLAGLVLALLLGHLVGRRERGFLIWPALALTALFIGLSFAQIAAAPNVLLGLSAFRAGILPIVAALLIAYAGWSETSYRRLARGVVVLAGLVSAYAVIQWLLGPTDAERELALQPGRGVNMVEGRLRVFGSFQTGHQLGFFAAIAIPYCLAFTLSVRGGWQRIGALSTVLAVGALLASEGRAALVAAVIGVVLVLVLLPICRSSRGLRLGTNVAAAGAVVAAAAVAFVFVSDNPGTSERFERILNPGQDAAFQSRLMKWDDAIDEVGGRPLGLGLGTGGSAQLTSGPYLTIASYNLDNSYLKIAYEQGFAMMILFAAVLAALLWRLLRGGVAANDQETAWNAIGAGAALAGIAVLFYTGLYIEAAPAYVLWAIVGLGLRGLVRTPGTNVA